MKTHLKIVSTICFGLLSLALKAQPVEIDSVILTTHLQQLVAKYKIPDAELALINTGKVVYRFAKRNNPGLNNFLIGSCSKSFASLSVLMLSKEGKIDIDRPVISYLSWFKLKDSKTSEQITVRHLLNQTSGIGSQYGFFDYATDDFETYKGELLKHLSKIELLNIPGKNFCYSNLNYLLLGLVVESVTNTKYTDYLTNMVFPNIGMKQTFAGMSNEILNKNVQPYQYYFFNLPFPVKFYPHSEHALAYGYISSNIEDLAVYLNFLINKGITTKGDTLLNEKSYKELTSPVNGYYAMGWGKINYNNMDMFLHTGLDENYSSILSFNPETKTGIIALCNINSLEFCSLAQSSVVDMLAKKSFFQPFSMEMVLRWLPGIIILLMLFLLIFNIYRWKKYNFKIGFHLKVFPVFRLLAGIALSVACILLIRKTYGISVFSVINFEPDIAIGVLVIAVLGISSSVIRYFGTFARTIILKG